MGVINVTPDSFSDGGDHLDPEAAVERGLELESQGADILDVGGESTRPGSEPVPEDVEMRRVLPVLEGLAARARAALSIDTTKSAVARAALDRGATIVNDVSAGRGDDRMLPLVAERGATCILMHMQGTPRTMQAHPVYDNVVAEVRDFLRERAGHAVEAGVDRERIWIDPGIGFGKALAHNLELLARLGELLPLGFPICLGVSRKSFIAAVDREAGVEPAATAPEAAAGRIGGTAAAVALGVANGARILRVHDVAIMAQAARVARAIAERAATGD
jgi:dihydropteroate synthase